MTDIITLPELCVRIVTGSPEDDPHRQGFAAIYAEIVTGDRDLISVLSKSKQQQRVITLRCAMLDVIGKVTKETAQLGNMKFVFWIDDLCYRKPNATPIVERLHQRTPASGSKK